MNPWLKNPDHIEAGQQIRVPVSNELPANQGTAERVPAALREAEKR
jgi:hypothetical protein